MSKRSKALIAVLTLVSLGAGLYAHSEYRRAESLAQDLAIAEGVEGLSNVQNNTYYTLEKADQLLFAGNYRAARNAYRAIAADTTALINAADIDFEARFNHIGLLNAYTYELDTLRALAGQPAEKVFIPLPTSAPLAPIAPLALEDTRPSQYDSLNFALRKAEMRVRSLEGRLRQNSGGNYLTFKSTKGSDVYYVGDVREGKANGSGVALLSTGSRYQGEWRDNRREGRGTFYWPDGAYYEGNYVDDERDGQGTYHFPDGSVFVGDWEADLRNGEGIYYDKDGEVVARGIWDDDELVERG